MVFINRKSRRGFTVAELLVSISIFMMITTVVLANFRSNSRAEQVRFNAQDLASIIRKAQLNSQYGRSVPNDGNVVPIGGFGIHIEQCSTGPCEYRLFADIDGELDYDANEEAGSELYALPVSMNVVGLPENPLDLVFKPPQPFVCVNSDCDGATDIEIVLEHRVNQERAVISINPLSGKVSVD